MKNNKKGKTVITHGNLFTFLVIVVALFLGVRYLGNNVNDKMVQNPYLNEVLNSEKEEGHSDTETVHVVSNEIPDIVSDLNLHIDKSKISWTAKKIGLSESGSISFESGTLSSKHEGELIIDLETIISESAGLDDHLKNEDFFDVIKFPKATFLVEKIADGKVMGSLEIKGITLPFEAPANINKIEKGLHITSTFSLDRTLWNITFGSGSFFKNLGDKVIDDLVSIDVVLHFEE